MKTKKVVKAKTVKKKTVKTENIKKQHLMKCDCGFNAIELPIETKHDNKTYQLFGCTVCGNVEMMEID